MLHIAHAQKGSLGHEKGYRKNFESHLSCEQDEKQNTALHYACGYGRSEQVQLLLEKGAKAVTENGSGQTPLDLVM